ncbi:MULTISPECIES: FG-GAP-like repeat-containing protein [Moorena]|uniref:rhamnogalacturonan lyase family protein n=1 Tax=Moorena TaxID=1155738 RepID=UPI001E472423|nr:MULTISPECIES: FG-GAP-like repeat-containing protein [Moorena]
MSNLPYSTIKPQVIELKPAASDRRLGGLIAADINDDGQKDLIITKPGYIAAYSHSGKALWSKSINIQVTGKSESQGLPGNQAPGVQAADVDGDQKTEVLFLTKDNTLHIVEGFNGETQKTIKLPSPEGTEGWEHLVVANFRGKGDRDLLLQATNAEGYRMGRYLAAYPLDNLLKGENLQPLWSRDDFLANAHNGARVADLDGDGKDEVLGGTIISPDGEMLLKIPIKGHIDSLFVADVRPDIPGLEVVALEEGGGNRVFLYNRDRVIWKTHYKHQEPQNAAIGDFDPQRPGLEVWCRSRYQKHQKPFVFDAQGQLIANYQMDDVAPKGWTDKGVEVIVPIDWTGESRQLVAVKERHKPGDVGIFDALSGQFLHRFKEQAARLYVADVSGDWREEVMVLNGNQLDIYSNPEPNPNLDRPRLWTQNHYRRSKMTWNYYSP